MKAIMIASQIIWSNSQEVVAAGGVESLSNVPFFVSRKNPRLGHGCLHDIILHDGINDFLERIDVSYYADEMAREYSITRQEQDEYGLQSFNKAIAAGQNGYFSDELVPISLKGKGKSFQNNKALITDCHFQIA